MSDLKKQLRQSLRAALTNLSSDFQTNASRLACELFLSQPQYRRAGSLLIYMPAAGELKVQSILDRAIADKKQIALPRFVPDQSKYAAFFIGDKPLRPGPFGILEPTPDLPVPLNQLDLIVVPGLGFDARGRRLGRGKGFYDRILSEVSGVKCGICFDEQIVEGIPVEPHDVRVDFIATPTRWLDCRGSAPD